METKYLAYVDKVTNDQIKVLVFHKDQKRAKGYKPLDYFTETTCTSKDAWNKYAMTLDQIKFLKHSIYKQLYPDQDDPIDNNNVVFDPDDVDTLRFINSKSKKVTKFDPMAQEK